MAQGERGIHGVDQIAGENSTGKTCTEKAHTEASDAALHCSHGSAMAAGAQQPQVNGLCFSVNNYPHTDSISGS